MRAILSRAFYLAWARQQPILLRNATITRPLSKIKLTDSKAVKEKLRSDHKELFESNTRINIDDLIDKKKLDNAFDMFGLEHNFDVSLSKLRTEKHNLLRILHPDKFMNQDRDLKDQSDSLCVKVNEYYNILVHPYERGKYLLSLKTGQKMDTVEKRLEKVQLDSKFLSDMMEIGEKIHDDSLDLRDKHKTKYILEDQLRSLTSEIKKNFENNEYDEIYNNLGRLKFVANNYLALSDQLD